MEYSNTVCICADHPAMDLVIYCNPCVIIMHSNHQVNWRAVLWGIALQFVFALIILRWTWGYNAFQWLGDRVAEFLAHAEAGAEFLFGSSYTDHFFAFAVSYVALDTIYSFPFSSLLVFLFYSEFLLC